jgi:hypothetical protein
MILQKSWGEERRPLATVKGRLAASGANDACRTRVLG